MTMQLIETKTLGTAAASIEFTSIPQDGTDLYVQISCASTTSNPHAIRFNGITTGYTFRVLINELGTIQSYTQAAYSLNGIFAFATFNSGATNPSSSVVYVPNYAGSQNKSVSVDAVNEANTASVVSGIVAGLWSNTAAITSLSVICSGGNFAIGSMVSLYKITRGSGGAIVS
jgi:hypothetical protein